MLNPLGLRPGMTLLALAGILLCSRLSYWQWDRYQQKAAIESERQSAGESAPLSVDRLDPLRLPMGERIQLQGRWEVERSLLLDNQTSQGRPGGHVWTVVRLPSGQRLLVDRGWTLLPADRSQEFLPEPPQSTEIRGILRDLPRAGIAAPPQCPQTVMPRLNFPTAEDLNCTLQVSVLPALLLLDADLPGAYKRAWQRFEIPPERHQGYAVQWAALALTILILLLRYGRRPHPPTDSAP